MEECVVERGQDERESAVGLLKGWICNITWGVFFIFYYSWLSAYKGSGKGCFWGGLMGLDIDGDC